ncbi:MAG TPA: Gfo/Idh/MocA family oxidoreductase [Verrucomicrobiae bacterium]
MNKVKVAVLGTGSLGQHHARIYSELHAAGLVEMTGIYDANTANAKAVADKNKLHVFTSLDEAAAASDALNIVTPTITHYEIAKKLLGQGKHVLVEKPITDQTAQATELIELARQKNCVLQVGHVERFNPVFKYVASQANDPRFIECQRLSPFPARSMDIGVVLDLMIHDLDIILKLVKSPVVSVDAMGMKVLSQSEDIANARIKFANGCVAAITASRVSADRLRKIRVYNGPANPCYISADFRLQEGQISRLAPGSAPLPAGASIVSEFGQAKIVREPAPIEKGEPLKLELEGFVASVRERKPPVVTGEDAKQALDLAFEITRQVRAGW